MASDKEKNENDFKKRFSPSFDCEGIPACLEWTPKDVADWIEYLGFPQYRDCFLSNGVNGRKLITVHASSLPRIGITDFEHIKFIARKVREVTGIEKPDWMRPIRLQHRERLGLFLERRAFTGTESDAEKFQEFHRLLDLMEEHGPAQRIVDAQIKENWTSKRSK
ncbi:sterile alpha motif domain-containing protein 15-like [Xenia sp. Carnegie-2017]|uniref:sterile alpha motif domain-containing protein 15-like n=1 Tax=Xenia sp. Carnegie-2017 TaxID=2897299 RepID=UPI001F043F3B|nr:sterile alpha motif domain-containing protein 15-like [Xenia sp. Carnegie-2017]